MAERVAIFIVVGFHTLYVVPFFFMAGNPFVETDGVYFDNVYNAILQGIIVTVCLMVPFAFPKINTVWKILALVMGAWSTVCLFYELTNFLVPERVLNNPYDYGDYLRWSMGSIFFSIFAYTLRKWKESQIPRE